MGEGRLVIRPGDKRTLCKSHRKAYLVCMSNETKQGASEAAITMAARAEYARCKSAGLDEGVALDNAHDVVRDLVGACTGRFDDDTLTWMYDESIGAA